ncbi:homeobox protein DLL-4 isoform X2 [Chelonia mydas]|uniref:homeobox protein DLL-4 isoform X2 n=1 Tax=Chelonia mydas TaxID=8469 RepID=UPI001CA7C856|nr:homeobox protein DLL-4 isoform X2 [Chelonia mydas]
MKVQAWQNQKESSIAETLSRKDQQLFDVRWNQLRIHGKKYLNLPQAEMLLGMMGLTCHQIRIWFQNRRGKHWRLYTGDGTPGSSLCTLQVQSMESLELSLLITLLSSWTHVDTQGVTSAFLSGLPTGSVSQPESGSSQALSLLRNL